MAASSSSSAAAAAKLEPEVEEEEEEEDLHDYTDSEFLDIMTMSHTSFNKPTGIGYIGVTTLINNFRKDDNVWKNQSARGQRRGEVQRKPGATSYTHDAMISVMHLLFVQHNFQVISTEQWIIYERLCVIDKSGIKKVLRGKLDIIARNEDTNRLAIIDMKTVYTSTTTTLMAASLKQKHELQLRLYALLLRSVLALDYAPEIYIVGSRPPTGENVLWQFPLDLLDIASVEAAAGLYPASYYSMMSASWPELLTAT